MSAAPYMVNVPPAPNAWWREFDRRLAAGIDNGWPPLKCEEYAIAFAEEAHPGGRDAVEVEAVLRDASGYRTHRLTTSAHEREDWTPSYHVTRDGGRTTACGRDAAEFTREQLDKVPAHRRCQRSGCRQAWPS